MSNTRLAGQVLTQLLPAVAASAGVIYGVPAIAAHLHGRAAGYANPQHSGLPGAVGYGLAGGFNPLVMGGGGYVGAGLSGLAYMTGHNAGRQAATDYMLGPGINANQIQWQRLPVT